MPLRHSMPAVTRTLRQTLCALCCLIAVGHARAQAADDGDHLNFTLSGEHDWDDNLFRLPDHTLPDRGTRHDEINLIAGAGQLQTFQGLQQFVLSGTLEDERFTQNTFLNSVVGNGRAEWDWRTAGDLSGTLGGTFAQQLSGFANNRSFARDLVDLRQYFASGRLGIGARWALRASGYDQKVTHSLEIYDYDDAHTDNGSIGIEYKAPTGYVLGWDYKHARTTYTDPTSDYNDNSALLRWNVQLAGDLQLTGDAGYQSRQYTSRTVGNFSGDVWNFGINFQPTARTSLDAAAWRELRAWLDTTQSASTTLLNSDHYVSRGVRLAPGWNSGAHWKLTLAGAYEIQDYVAGDSTTFTREDKVASSSATLGYGFLKYFDVAFGVRFERRNSTNSDYSYDDRLLNLKLSGSW